MKYIWELVANATKRWTFYELLLRLGKKKPE